MWQVGGLKQNPSTSGGWALRPVPEGRLPPRRSRRLIYAFSKARI